jgi:hypothetical protein
LSLAVLLACGREYYSKSTVPGFASASAQARGR